MTPETLQERVGVQFKDTVLLHQALTHRSFSEETGGLNNERLEFLGDAVLELTVTEMLFRRVPEATEGQLSRIRAHLVQTRRLAEVGRSWGIGEALSLGRGELRSGGRDKDSLLADAVEALVGALYLDQGLGPVSEVVERSFEPWVSEIDDPSIYGVDPKSQLQELTMARWRLLPKYELLHTDGPAHAKSYSVRVLVGDKVEAEGTGSSKRKAQRAAARMALLKIEGVL